MVYGKSLVTPEFNQMCVEAGVEARVQPMVNPGNPFRAMRLITFKNFGNGMVTVTQYDKKRTKNILQPKGELQIMLQNDEHLPLIQKGIPGDG